jgi:hypothetical protein
MNPVTALPTTELVQAGLEGLRARLGDEAEGAELVRPLRALEPELDTIATIPITALQQLHMDPEHPVVGAGDGMLLTDVTRETIAALVATVDGSPLLSAEIRHLGGELGRVRPGAGALASLEAPSALRGRDGDDARAEGGGRGHGRACPDGARGVGRRDRVPQLRRAAAGARALLRRLGGTARGGEGGGRPGDRDPPDDPVE